MNEKADTLVNKAAHLPPDMHFMTFSQECLFSIDETQPRAWSPHLSRRLVQHLAKQRWTTQAQVAGQSGNLTEQWLSLEGAYREVLGAVLQNQKFDQQSKHSLQAITHTFPTQRWIYRYKDPTVQPNCKLCGCQWDSVGHIQCRCPALKRARIQEPCIREESSTFFVLSTPYVPGFNIIRKCSNLNFGSFTDTSVCQNIVSMTGFWVAKAPPKTTWGSLSLPSRFKPDLGLFRTFGVDLSTSPRGRL